MTSSPHRIRGTLGPRNTDGRQDLYRISKMRHWVAGPGVTDDYIDPPWIAEAQLLETNSERSSYGVLLPTRLSYAVIPRQQNEQPTTDTSKRLRMAFDEFDQRGRPSQCPHEGPKCDTGTGLWESARCTRTVKSQSEYRGCSNHSTYGTVLILYLGWLYFMS
ncbi:hypothetical protein OTU49_006429 [Cherax quadricarinatus]|uniref:Uncharacterized protein n=1 Tax=Cherax quadricarinatus TaxID=27406 RepID=A0AAW0WNB0_CHEQU